ERDLQSYMVPSGVQSTDHLHQHRSGRSELEEEEIAIRLRIPKDWWDVRCDLADRLFGLAADCVHSCFVARVHTRSSAFEECVSYEFQISRFSCCLQGSVCGLAVGGPRLPVHEVLHRRSHPGC